MSEIMEVLLLVDYFVLFVELCTSYHSHSDIKTGIDDSPEKNKNMLGQHLTLKAGIPSIK